MPGIENWLTCPLNIIQTLFDQNGYKNSECVLEYFQKRCETPHAIQQIPSLNDVPLHNLKPDSVVRFRCMVQDMYDPEYYLSVYSVRDKSQKTYLRSGKYRDVAERKTGEEIDQDSVQNVTSGRQTLYCVPLPGETEWVKNVYYSSSYVKMELVEFLVALLEKLTYKSHGGSKYSSLPSSSKSPDRTKRGREDETESSAKSENMEMASDSVEVRSEENTGEMEVEEDCEAKRSRTENSSGTSACVAPDLNFPLPGEAGPACLVKIYDEVDVYKLNDAVEFIGILSVDPSLASFKNEQSEDDILTEPEFESVEEKNAHSPPPSLVPRIHVLTAQKLAHNNPNLPQIVEQGSDAVKSEIGSIRSKLLTVLEHLVLGDSLAAEYLLCHLLSTVPVDHLQFVSTSEKIIYSTAILGSYSRIDVMPVGKFCLNISGCPRQTNYSELFNKILQKLLTKVYFLSMSLENMNRLQFSPQKDYKANRLKSGVLQLSDHTNLIVDETALEPGQLDTTGVKNITALGNLIRWQKVDYDFVYHNLEFQTNLQVLVLSEGKSLLPSDYHVHMESKMLPENLASYFVSLDSHVSEELENQLRDYLTLVKLCEYNMSDDLQKAIQDDFVQIRKEDPKSMSIDDFHSLLSLVRLLSISHGFRHLTDELWNKAKAMEHQRKQRITEMASNGC